MVKTASKKLKGEKITPTQTDITSQIESTTQLFQNVDNNQNDITTSINNLNNVNDVSNTILNKTKSKLKATKVTKAKPNESTSIIQANTVDVVNVVKAKRGRKSKKDLMAALNMANNIVVANPLQLQINEINNVSSDNLLSMSSASSASSATFLDCAQNMVISSNHDTTDDNHDMINKDLLISDHTPVIKKRGRKPKGGKIIQQVVSINNQNVERPNIILHLKCSMKDLQTSTNSCLIESFNFTNKNDLSYELLNSTNINEGKSYIDSKTSNQIMADDDYDDDDDCTKDRDNTKDIWRKLKQLEHNLHVNNVNNKKSACFWCTHDFDNPPVYVPKHFINDTYHVYGCFCSPECGVAYLMNESIDSSAKAERYHLLNHIYTKIYEYKKNIKPAPNPYYMLDKFCGNLSIQEYRSLLRNERLFLIVDKPLTRILPELHEDNDEFILNNKIIPSNNYQLKSRLQKKKTNKGTIMNETFGLSSTAMIE
jgi:hypothetical protein